MKKVILSLALMVAAASASAQWYVGAGLTLDSNPSSATEKKSTTGSTTTTTETTGTDKDFDFSIAPEIGYCITDKFCVGMTLTMGSGKADDNQEITSTNGASSSITKDSKWEVRPYAQYYYKSFGKVNAYLQGGFYVGGDKSSTTSESWDATKNAVVADPSSTETTNSTFGLFVTPGMDFKISDKISLWANLDFLSLQYYTNSNVYTQTKPVSGEDKIETTTKSSGFNGMFNSGTVSKLSTITFGAYYNF